MSWTDEMSGYQQGTIHRLLEERAVTSKLASRIIMMLEDCPDRNNGGGNKDIAKAVNDRVEREDK